MRNFIKSGSLILVAVLGVGASYFWAEVPTRGTPSLKYDSATGHLKEVAFDSAHNGRNDSVAYMDGTPAQNPSFWLTKTIITQKYQKMGAFWVPAMNSSNSDVRVFGHSEVKIEYAEYRLNPDPQPAVSAN